MIKYKADLIILLCVFFLNSLIINAAQAVIIGKILEEGTNRPIGLEFQLSSNNGKVTKCRSNSKDGSYQQILTPGETYNIGFFDYVLVSGNNTLSIPDSKTYLEINRDFIVRKVYTGMELNYFKLFAPNQSELYSGNIYILEDLKKFMDLNKKAEILISVSSNDSWFQTITKKEKIKVKNKTKTITKKITTEEQLEQLLDLRLEAVRQYFENSKVYAKRITYKKELIVNKPPKTTKVKKTKKKGAKNQEAPSVMIPNIPNTKIIVGKIKNL